MATTATSPSCARVAGYGSVVHDAAASSGSATTDETRHLLLSTSGHDGIPMSRTSQAAASANVFEFDKRSATSSMAADYSSSCADEETAAFGGHGVADEDGGMQQYSKNGHTNPDRKRKLRKIAIQSSLYVNLLILLAKLLAYWRTMSLSVLAALVDTVLDVISQMVLSYTEHKSERQHGRSSATYPAGAARLEPIGVLTCSALMGMASFEVLKESLEALIFDRNVIEGQHMSSVISMVIIVLVKVVLLAICKKAGEEGRRHTSGLRSSKSVLVVSDPTLEALAQDHLNDALSNAVAALALLTAMWHPALWFFDPLGAIIISIYIIYSWYATGKEQIEQLTGKAAPDDFITELKEVAENHNVNLTVDVCRAYHFGPKFLVELEVVLPRDTLLCDSHDIGMDLQYEIEAREEVERCFVHIDYEKREYDEHVVSKNPELREKYGLAGSQTSQSSFKKSETL